MSANPTETKSAAVTPAATPAVSPTVPEKQARKTAGKPPVAEPAGVDPENAIADQVTAMFARPRSEGNEAEPEETEDPVETPEAPAEDEPAEDPVDADPAQSDEEAPDSGETEETPAGDVVEPTPEAGEAEAETEAPKKPAPVQARINELTARAKSAEENLSKATERLASFEAEASGRYDPGALEHIDSTEQLNKQRSRIVALHQQLLRSPQGIDLPDPKDPKNTLSYDAQGVADMLGHTFRLLQEDVPARSDYLRQKAEAEAQAVTAYPWLKDTRSESTLRVQGAIEKNPALRRIGPNYRLVAADAMIGQMLREAGVEVTPATIAKLKGTARAPATSAVASTAAARPALRKTPPAAPSRAGVIPARTTARSAGAASAQKRLNKSDGNMNDVASFISASMQ
jgi:hypothetical protein